MAETKKDQLTKILQDMKKIGNILGSAVISKDGLVIASNLSDSVDEDTFAAMSAAMEGAAETAAQELNQGELNQIIVDAEKGKIITIAAGKKALLVILANTGINLGLALLELGKAAYRIEKQLT